jgi:hypothetical protein
MIDIKVTVPDIEKAVFRSVKESIEKKLAAVRCPEHRQPPRVTASGTSVSNLKWKVDGCCRKLIDATNRALR